MTAPARLHPDDVDAIAERVADKLEERLTVARKQRPAATVTAEQQKRARDALVARGIIPRRVG